MENLKLNSASYIITPIFIQNVHRVILFDQPVYHDILATRLYPFFTFWPTTDVFLVSDFFGAIPFFIVVSSMGRCSLQYVGKFLFVLFSLLLHVFLLI